MKNFCKKALLLSLFLPASGWAIFPAPPGPFHTGIMGYTFDVGSAGSRILSTAVKYFLSDDTNLIAELVWKEGSGGCGGCYGDEPSAGGDLKLAAVLADISIETDIYQAESLKKTCVADLAQQRLDLSVDEAEQTSLNDLTERAWLVQRQSQRRSIQALTDALNMKRLYNDLKDVATSSLSDYSNYSAAVSSVASKRLLLDELLALKKRVIAARIRTRAQTLEANGVDFKRVTVSPDLSEVCATIPTTDDDTTDENNNQDNDENPQNEGEE